MCYWLLVEMVLNQVRFSVWLVFVVGLSEAHWPKWETIQVPGAFQINEAGQPSLQVNAGLPSGWLQSDSQSRSSAAVPLELQLQNPSDSQDQQVVQRLEKKITWRFPVAPQIPTPPAPVHVERPAYPVPVQGVTARCTESAVYVSVRKDLFGTGTTLNTADLTLGGCAAKRMDASSQVHIFEVPLHDCNSKLLLTANELVYVFTLGIASVPLSGLSIIRRAGIKVSIECHYQRHHNVSSSAFIPAWVPYASAQAAEEQLVFSLKLMQDDWESIRQLNQYYLAEVINIEASVLQFSHVPLRVLVDSCVATTVPDTNAFPRYSFIRNYGCLVNGKLGRSSSRIMSQNEADKLRFQLEAFKFEQMNSSLVYIECILKATAASAPADPEHKACSVSDYRWTAAYGSDQVCSCCSSSSCTSRKNRHLKSAPGSQQEQKLSVGPLKVL